MPYSRANDIGREPQGLSKYLPAEKVRETDSQTRIQANGGIARYLATNQKETK